MQEQTTTSKFKDQEELKAFIVRLYGDRIEQWEKRNPGKRLPIVMIEGEPVWLTRRQRLAMAKRRTK